jgi:two-component sensor histidine kinase
VIAVLEFFNDVITERDPHVLLIARTFGDQVGRVLERREVLQRQEMLVAELNHRVKNMLAVVLAIAAHTARGTNSIDLFKKEFSGRLLSLGRSYSLLTASEWKQTPIKSIIEEIVMPHVPDQRLDFDGPEISLSAKATLAVSMILHELVTNAVKYGALSVPAGRITLRWMLADREGSAAEVALCWQESGLTGLQEPEQRSGFGTKLIERSTRQELGGRVETVYRPKASVTISGFPCATDSRFGSSKARPWPSRDPEWCYNFPKTSPTGTGVSYAKIRAPLDACGDRSVKPRRRESA